MNEHSNRPVTPEESGPILLDPVRLPELPPVVGEDGKVRTPVLNLTVDASGRGGLTAGAIVALDAQNQPQLVCRVAFGYCSVMEAELALIRTALQIAPVGTPVTVRNDCQDAVIRVVREIVAAGQGRATELVEVPGVSPAHPLARQVFWEPRCSTPAGVLADHEAGVALSQYEAMLLERMAKLQSEHGQPALRVSVLDTVVAGTSDRVVAVAARFLRPTGSCERTEIRVRRAPTGGLRTLASLMGEVGIADDVLQMRAAIEIHEGAALLGEGPRSELEAALVKHSAVRPLARQVLQMLLGAVVDSVELHQLKRELDAEIDTGVVVNSGSPMMLDARSSARDHVITTSLLLGELRPSRLADMMLVPETRFVMARSCSLEPVLGQLGVQTHPGGERLLQVRLQHLNPGPQDERGLSMRLVAPLGSGIEMPRPGDVLSQQQLRSLVLEILGAPLATGDAAEALRQSQQPYLVQTPADLTLPPEVHSVLEQLSPPAELGAAELGPAPSSALPSAGADVSPLPAAEAPESSLYEALAAQEISLPLPPVRAPGLLGRISAAIFR